MTEAIPETWSERNKISISAEGGTEVAFEGITATTDIDIGDKDIEQITATGGGNLVKYVPQGMTTVTLEAYPIEAGTDAGATGKGFFDLLHTKDVLQPHVIPLDFVRTRYRIAILWTDDSSNTGAAAAVGSGKRALRVACCGFFTSCKPSFTDGVLKFTVIMKCPAFKKDLTANVRIDSCDSTAEGNIDALVAFTSANNFVGT